ncbi:glycosyltransferase family 4 protein [Candidatus Woesearchaeota archaeon]|nr:glycosyltransferase family 4 protein [Candidatus Woesearchaeota archaeon]
MKNKILMISPEPFYQPRGTPISILHRIKALSKLGYKIDLLAYHIGGDVKIKNMKVYRIPDMPLIKNIKIGPSYTKILLDFFLLSKAISLSRKNKYDFIHAHEEACFIGIILKKMFRIPLIYDMHSSMPQQLANYNFSKNIFITGFLRWLEKKSVKNSDAVIVISPHLKHIADSIEAGKSVLIENMAVFDNKAAKKDVFNLKRKLKLKNEKVIMYTGTFEVNQGLDLLIGTVPIVLKFSKNVKYVLVGGEKNQIEKLKELADKLNVSEYVIFTGQKSEKEIPSCLAIADVVVSPRSKGTNTPLKIYSYLKSGKPIVATDIYSHTQVLNKNVAVLTKLDESSFADGIIKLLKDNVLRKKLSTNSKKLGRSSYSYEEYINKTKLLYDSVWSQSGTL